LATKLNGRNRRKNVAARIVGGRMPHGIYSRALYLRMMNSPSLTATDPPTVGPL
jgi:hypothetical protein